MPIASSMILLMILLLSLGFWNGCSSVPDFKPTHPVQEASSFKEALDICASYQIPDHRDDNGNLEKSVVAVLTPWIRCFEDTLRKFPDSQRNEAFVMFFRELQGLHDAGNPASIEIIDGPAMNLVVRIVVKHLQDPHAVYSKLERKELENMLPHYAIYLAERGSFDGNWGKRPITRVKEKKLERNFVDEKKVDVLERDRKLSTEQKDYCKSYRKYKTQVYDVEELASYKKLLDDPANQTLAQPVVAQKLTERYENLKNSAEKEGKDLDTRLAELRKTSPWFHNGYCLAGLNND